jgi:hypothetical protein
MSLDHLLFRAPDSGPMSSWPPEAPPAFGKFTEVRQRLELLLPDLQWERDRTSWLGRSPSGGLELQTTPDADDDVRFLTVRRADRAEVERICLALGVAAVGPGFAVYRPDTGRWTGEA